jgi:rhodanese-related sulfurtransferase
MPSRESSADTLTADASGLIETLTPRQLAVELERDEVVLIDLREPAERRRHGSIPGAVHVPADMLVFCADPALPVHAAELERSRRLILYCAAGQRSPLAVLTLKAMAYPDVAHLVGGFEGWREAGGVVEAGPESSGADGTGSSEGLSRSQGGHSHDEEDQTCNRRSGDGWILAPGAGLSRRGHHSVRS